MIRTQYISHDVYTVMIEAFQHTKCFAKWNDGSHKVPDYPHRVKDAIDEGYLTPYTLEKEGIVNLYSITEKGYKLISAWESLGVTIGIDGLVLSFDTFLQIQSVKID